MKLHRTIKLGWLASRSAIAVLMLVLVGACSEEVVETNKMVGTWVIDQQNMSSNKKSYIQATRGAEKITFTHNSAKSGSMEMPVTYEPTKAGFIVTFAGMEAGTEYKFIDDNTFEIYIPEAGFFRYIRQVLPAPKQQTK